MKDFINKAVALVTLEAFLLTSFGGALFAGEPRREVQPGSTPPPEREVVAGESREITPEEGGVLSFGEVRLVVPPGAVEKTTTLSVEELRDVWPLEPGMTNLTGHRAGYRFLPKGMTFTKEVQVTIPYDADAALEVGGPGGIYTHFYDEKNHRWDPLKRVSFDPHKRLITSLTTHFTDLINSWPGLARDAGHPLLQPDLDQGYRSGQPGLGH